MLNRKGEGILGSGARWRALIRLNLKTVLWQQGWYFKWQNILHSSWKDGEGASSITMKYIPSSYGENWIYIGNTCCGRQPKVLVNPVTCSVWFVTLVLGTLCWMLAVKCSISTPLCGSCHTMGQISHSCKQGVWGSKAPLAQTGWSGQMPPHLSYQLKPTAFLTHLTLVYSLSTTTVCLMPAELNSSS